MKKQLQGISLILFGIILMLFAIIDPYVPALENIPTVIAPWIGLASGIVGIVFSFSKEEK